jgi:lipopolysaccharide transport system ATP-binding protein
MPVDFRNVSLAPLDGFTASAPGCATIGLVGSRDSGISELLKIAGGAVQPTGGDMLAPPKRQYFKSGDLLSPSADVVAIDHALAMEDAVSRIQILAALERLRRLGSTIFIASHELSLLQLICDEIWWLDGGRLLVKADPRDALTQYREHVATKIREWGQTVPQRLEPPYRYGNEKAEVVSVETLDKDGNATIVWKSREAVNVRATVRFHEAVANPVLGMMIRTRIGVEVYGTNTELEALKLGPRGPGDMVRVSFSFACHLCPGAYTITIASHDPDGTPHDWLDDAVAINVVGDRYTAGVADLRATVVLE